MTDPIILFFLLGIVADKITSHLQSKYYENFAMVIYRHDVAVLRPHKFEGNPG